MVQRVEVAPGERHRNPRPPTASRSGSRWKAFPVHGKIALYLERGGPENNFFGTEEGDAIGVKFWASADVRKSAPSMLRAARRWTSALLAKVEGADCLFFDGTTYTWQ